MFVTVMGLPIQIGCRVGDGGRVVAYSPDYPLAEVTGRQPMATMRKLAELIEQDMSRALWQRRVQLLERYAA